MKKIFKVFGKLKIEIRKYREVMGHDDSLPYNAELWVNNQHFADCFNDGWGGETTILPKDNKLLEEVCTTIGRESITQFGHTFQYTLPILADELAVLFATEKTIERNSKDGLVFKENESIFFVPLKNKDKNIVPIREILSTASGQKFLKSVIEKYEQRGCVLLNRNIRFTI